MKIVHLCLACFFPDNYSYQENLLPKYHKLLGHDVEVIASLQSFNERGNVCYLQYSDYEKAYINENGLKVTRLDYKKPYKIFRKMKRFLGLKSALEEAQPDVLFVHGCQFLDSDIVVQYAKNHPGLKLYVDNHADFSNSAKGGVSLNLLHKRIWKHCAQRLLPYTKMFYGVLPARVDFLKNIYGIPADKVKLLVMGSEDDKVEYALRPDVRDEMRRRYAIQKEDFLIVFGGKIDMAKQQTILLMQAVNRLKDNHLKLIVFGSVVKELEDKVRENCSDRVQYIGWVKSEESYNYFGMADLVCFPGRHSVFWEQVAGMGIPMLVKRWEGTTHIDTGGNVLFLERDSIDEIVLGVSHILENDNYRNMKSIAWNSRKKFLYSGIAKASLK